MCVELDANGVAITYACYLQEAERVPDGRRVSLGTSSIKWIMEMGWLLLFPAPAHPTGVLRRAELTRAWPPIS